MRLPALALVTAAALAGCASLGGAGASDTSDAPDASAPITASSTQPASVPQSSTPDAPVSSAPATFLASRTMTGGMCPDAVCSSTFAVSSDGAWNLVSNTASHFGVLSPGTLAALTVAAADTSMLEAPKFTGTCPSAYDGSEIIYSWSDVAGTTQTVSACDKAVPDSDPLVVALERAQEEAGAGPAAAPSDDLAALAQRTLEIAQAVIGLTEAEAVQTLAGVSSVPITSRVVARDGVGLPVTEDYSPTRVNLTVDSGHVTAVSVG